MRVSDASRHDRLQWQLERTGTDVDRAMERLSTGRQINRLSDDPDRAVIADRLGAETAALDTYARAADNARAWLATQDTALQSAMSLVQRARRARDRRWLDAVGRGPLGYRHRTRVDPEPAGRGRQHSLRWPIGLRRIRRRRRRSDRWPRRRWRRGPATRQRHPGRVDQHLCGRCVRFQRRRRPLHRHR